MIGPDQCPPEIDVALKAIDSKAELIHLGGTRWWLGIRTPNPAARNPLDLESAHRYSTTRPTIPDPAERALMEVELAKEFQMRQIMAAGFKPVALYVVEQGEFGEVVEDFRIRDFNWRTKSEEQLRKELHDATSMDVMNRRRIVEWGKQATEAAAEAFRFVFKGARSFMLGSTTGR
jgi:hypothetical protein